jgi:hypothetical protein
MIERFDMRFSPFGYYYFDGFIVDIFGYDEDTEQFVYSVETQYSSKVRKAKKQYKAPDKRNPWRFPYGTYIYIISPTGKKIRFFF